MRDVIKIRLFPSLFGGLISQFSPSVDVFFDVTRNTFHRFQSLKFDLIFKFIFFLSFYFENTTLSFFFFLNHTNQEKTITSKGIHNKTLGLPNSIILPLSACFRFLLSRWIEAERRSL